jgi:hypothetical protein
MSRQAESRRRDEQKTNTRDGERILNAVGTLGLGAENKEASPHAKSPRSGGDARADRLASWTPASLLLG